MNKGGLSMVKNSGLSVVDHTQYLSPHLMHAPPAIHAYARTYAHTHVWQLHATGVLLPCCFQPAGLVLC